MYKLLCIASLTVFIVQLFACANNDLVIIVDDPIPMDSSMFYFGADLSYVNEMLDCGAEYLSSEEAEIDPYALFSDFGTDIVRLRLWHNPDWTDYSNFDDVKLAIQRTKAQGMKCLLDFHYSDEWADPAKQFVPAAWQGVVYEVDALADSIYNYTYGSLLELHEAQLLPEMVQIGNEINAEILQDPDGIYNGINWDRNAKLLNAGIKAVRDIESDFDVEIDVMLHIAQPENAEWWFPQALNNQVIDFDWMGISYYSKWSSYHLTELKSVFQSLISNINKPLMLVETAYPFSLENVDNANNILGADALVEGYPASEEGQYQYIMELVKQLKQGGASGLIYWEPAWVSTDCHTLWGQGSHWDNATLINHEFKPTKALSIFNQ